MLTNIHIKNFKALKDADIALTNLNVLTGVNGMGKSSLIQSLLLLRQSNNLHNGRVELNSELVSLGKGRDVYYQYGEDSHIDVKLNTDTNREYHWSFEYTAEKEYLLSGKEYSRKEIRELKFLKDDFQYLHAERLGSRTTYQTAGYDIEKSKHIGMHGELAVHFLNVFGTSHKINYKQLLHPDGIANNYMAQVAAWLGEISPGTKLNTTAVPGTEIVLLDYQFETKLEYTNRFRPVNVGFGISYVLPVVLALLQADENRMIIIENPEALKHTKGYSRRINREHRLVYKVEDSNFIVLSCKGHYE